MGRVGKPKGLHYLEHLSIDEDGFEKIINLFNIKYCLGTRLRSGFLRYFFAGEKVANPLSRRSAQATSGRAEKGHIPSLLSEKHPRSPGRTMHAICTPPPLFKGGRGDFSPSPLQQYHTATAPDGLIDLLFAEHQGLLHRLPRRNRVMAAKRREELHVQLQR